MYVMFTTIQCEILYNYNVKFIFQKFNSLVDTNILKNLIKLCIARALSSTNTILEFVGAY